MGEIRKKKPSWTISAHIWQLYLKRKEKIHLKSMRCVVKRNKFIPIHQNLHLTLEEMLFQNCGKYSEKHLQYFTLFCAIAFLYTMTIT